MKLILVTFLMVSFSVPASILPHNNLSIPHTVKNTGITESEYNQVIDRFESFYSPIVRRHGGLLKISRLWNSPTVNAGTFRDEGGHHWHVKMYGGLARHSAMTKDGFALVLCHELGHHLGGAPKKKLSPRYSWSSAEGQADYFATLKCLRRLFASEEDEEKSLESIPTIVKEACRESFNDKKEYSTCLRISMAGFAVAKMNADITNRASPAFETPSRTVATSTMERHPKAQCRLDTYFQGALCPSDYTINVSQTDEVQGTCHEKLGDVMGLRPSCWFSSN